MIPLFLLQRTLKLIGAAPAVSDAAVCSVSLPRASIPMNKEGDVYKFINNSQSGEDTYLFMPVPLSLSSQQTHLKGLLQFDGIARPN